ncbi:hypothetical protein M513_05288, partial [Trichuris suis]
MSFAYLLPGSGEHLWHQAFNWLSAELFVANQYRDGYEQVGSNPIMQTINTVNVVLVKAVSSQSVQNNG